MGIINITPDSFHSGSRVSGVDAALQKAEQMLKDGADILDFGAVSTRPGAAATSQSEERIRLIPVIRAVSKAFPQAIISVDTYRSDVATEAVDCGAQMINDVGSGLLDMEMWHAVAKLGVPYVLMHNRDTPENMQSKAVYTNVVDEVIKELSQKMRTLHQMGLADIIVDPGFGFAKTPTHNFEMLGRLDEFHLLQVPLLVGISRKRMIWRTLQITPEEALNGTTALHMSALLSGASILRVHDVKEAVQCIALWEYLTAASKQRPL